MEILLWTGLFLPLAGFLFILTFSSTLPRKAINIIGPLTVLLSFCCFFQLFNAPDFDTTLYNWIPLKGLQTGFTLHHDKLSQLMTLIVTGVGFLIHAYSVGYMEHDEDLARYFSVMNFFIFSMLLLVLSANLLLFFVGWEGVGLASYLLIGYWYSRPAAQKAAKKAFVVNRIGDLGLLLGILLTFMLFGTSDMQEVNTRVSKEFVLHAPIICLLAVFYFWGACGKSAQMPLHTWLPDAMEGPTPVSALIHAATMVTAGVYLVVRMHPVFEVAPATLTLVALVGIITSIFAALSATSQTDIKRVLAYSTLSQLGLMFTAVGFTAYTAAMFHLTMHAFVKALLFLAAGNVIHMLHGATEMSQMGGLWRYLKKTNVMFLVGALAMAGIPPLAIFFSKDLILEDISSSTGFYVTGLAISLLTAYYMTRAYLLTFQGPSRTEQVSDAPKVMIVPVAILTILSLFGGLLGPYRSVFEGNIWPSIAVAFAGLAVAFIFNKSWKFFYKAFYINELYNSCIVLPMRALSKVINLFIEPKVIDQAVETTSRSAYETATVLQTIQSGQIRAYIAWIVAGSSLVILYLVFWGVS